MVVQRTVKGVVTDFISKGAARFPVEWMQSFSKVCLVVPYYHMVSNDFVPHVSPLYRFRTIVEFTADVEFLLRHFQPVTLTEIVEYLNGDRVLTRPSFHLTFDDGFREMYDVVAPILERTGVPATFFVNTAFLDGGGLAHHNALSVVLHHFESVRSKLGNASIRRVQSLLSAENAEHETLRACVQSSRYADNTLVKELAETLDVDLENYVKLIRPHLSSDQVTDLLNKGFSIGAHSHNHPSYADLSLSGQVEQTKTSIHILTARFQVHPKAFAFPHSDSGVGEDFFRSVFAAKLLDVSFGTDGFVRHFHPRNIERVSMEKTTAGAGQILARQFARAAYFRLRSHGPAVFLRGRLCLSAPL